MFKKNARSAEYLFYLFYLCSFTHGGRGTEATVLLFLLRYDGDAAKNVYLCSWLLILEPVISSSLVYWQHVNDKRNLRKNINPCTDVGKQFYI